VQTGRNRPVRCPSVSSVDEESFQVKQTLTWLTPDR